VNDGEPPDPAPALDVRVIRQVHRGLRLDVSLRLGREIGIVFGKSGAGKTTLLRLVAGFEAPDRGFVRVGPATLFDSDSGVDLPLRDRKVAMVFQDDLLFTHLDVASNVRFGLKGMARADAERRVEEVAALCGVVDLLERRPATLSGGERQRVGLARALAPRPRLLLCDEPVSALDLAGRESLIDRLRTIQVIERLPVLYVTHNPAEAVALGSKLFLLDQGRISAEGPPFDVLVAARGGSAGGFEGVRNVFPGQIERGSDQAGSSRVRLHDGPTIVVPRLNEAHSGDVLVSVLAEEILLARGPVQGLSARNVIAGEVVRVLEHGDDAEVLVRTAGLVWIASLVTPAVRALGLKPGAGVSMIVKARSCRVSPAGSLC
jgi:molybdate transport system ATP-binding protein